MTAPAVEQLKWKCVKHGWWSAFATDYHIGGPLGGWWYLYLPDDTVEGFGTKRDAMAHAQKHFEKHYETVA